MKEVITAYWDEGNTSFIEQRGELVRCKECVYRSLYCTEATDGTTLYTCRHPCSNDVPRPLDWFCADGKKAVK